jgi:hypothetical protein
MFSALEIDVGGVSCRRGDPGGFAGSPLSHVLKKINLGWVPVAHTCNPNYPGGRDQEN